MQFHQCVTFLYGCLATFLGVFIIAWSPSSNHSHLDFDIEGEGEDEEELAGLAELTAVEVEVAGLGWVRLKRLESESEPALGR